MKVGDLYAFPRGRRDHYLFKLVDPKPHGLPAGAHVGETACGMLVNPHTVNGGTLVKDAKYKGKPTCSRCKRVLEAVEKARDADQLVLFDGRPAVAADDEGEAVRSDGQRQEEANSEQPSPCPPPRPLMFKPAAFGTMLQEAIDALEEGIEGGTRCRCCGRHAQLVKRGMTEARAKMLVGLVRVQKGTGGEGVRVRDIPLGRKDVRVGGGEFAKLRYFGLIEEKPNEDPKKTRSGLWKATEAGVDFCYGRHTVPKYALVFNSRCWGHGGPQVTLLDLVGKEFDVRDLALLDIAADDVEV